jgi:hypothetical protein
MGQHPLSEGVLARSVDVLEIRAPPRQVLRFNPSAGPGEILAFRTDEARLEYLGRWPVRHPRGDQPRLPSGCLTAAGHAWVGQPDGAMP